MNEKNNSSINVVLLSGGSGKRLWPLSNDERSKQFIKFFKNEKGEPESMLQRMYREIKAVDKNALLTVATSITQIPSIENQLLGKVGISVEPFRRDTFNAIALSALYLKDVKGKSDDDVMVVCPVDPYVDSNYFKCLIKLANLAKDNDGLFLMGIKPKKPSEKFGYIIPENKKKISKVKLFKEKPDIKTAERYIKQGALINGGVFAFKLKYITAIIKNVLNEDNYDSLYAKYESLQKISFDYAVVEKEKDVKVLRFSGEWKDVGTWGTLTDTLKGESFGNVVKSKTCKNVSVFNELDIPIVIAGGKNLVVSASPEGILVADKDESDTIKPLVETLPEKIMFSERSWGHYKVLSADDKQVTSVIHILKNHETPYHSHEFCSETLIVVSGKGVLTVNGRKKQLASGTTVIIKKSVKHKIFATSNLVVNKIQVGKIKTDDFIRE